MKIVKTQKSNPWLPMNTRGIPLIPLTNPLPKLAKPAQKPKVPAQLPEWVCQINGMTCRAATKSEARAAFKKLLGVERLSPGFKIWCKENIPS